MAVQTTYNIGSAIRSVNNDSTAIASSGLRLVVGSTGLTTLAPIGSRGSFISLGYIEASKPGEAAQYFSGGKVPAIGTGATSEGDTAYTAASGQFANTSGANALIMGIWRQACPGAGQLGEVELNVSL
jgi:hypothetical protein